MKHPITTRPFPEVINELLPTMIMSADELAEGVATDYWPATACRRVVVELVWWKDLIEKGPVEQSRTENESEHYLVTELTVSDPSFVQKLSLTKDGRTITLRPSCGGYATSGPAVEQGSVVSAILKGYNDFKDAEASHAK